MPSLVSKRRLQSDGWVLATEAAGPVDHQRMHSSADGDSLSNAVCHLRLVDLPKVERHRSVKLFPADGQQLVDAAPEVTSTTVITY